MPILAAARMFSALNSPISFESKETNSLPALIVPLTPARVQSSFSKKISDSLFLEILSTGAGDYLHILLPYLSSIFMIDVPVIGINLNSLDFALKYSSKF